MFELACTNEEKIEVIVTPRTSTGAVAPIDGSVTVTVLSGEGTVEVSGQTTFWVISGLNPGDTEYLVEADADLGDGVVTISDIVKLHVAGALAANFAFNASAPVPK